MPFNGRLNLYNLYTVGTLRCPFLKIKKNFKDMGKNIKVINISHK